MREFLPIAIPGIKAGITIALLFGSYMTLIHLEDYPLSMRGLTAPFLLISTSIILYCLLRSSEVKTIKLAIATTAGIFILLHTASGTSEYAKSILFNFGISTSEALLSQFQIVNTLFWLFFVFLSLYELIKPPAKKLSAVWKTLAMTGSLGICFLIAFYFISAFDINGCD